MHAAPPVPEGPTRGQRVAGYAIVSTGLATCEAVGWIVAGNPTDLARDAWGWVTLILGAGFSLFFAAGTPFIGAWGRKLANHIPNLPSAAWEILRGNVLLLPAGILATVLVLLIAIFVPPPAPMATSSLEEGDIVVYSAFDESPRDPRRILIAQWNQANPKSPVEVEEVRPEQLHDRSVNDARDDSNEPADVYVLDNIWLPEFIEAEYIKPLNERPPTSPDTGYIPNVLDTCRDRYGGQPGLWCLPLNTDAGLMFSRSDLQGLPEPTNWDGYLGEPALQALLRVKENPANQLAATSVQAASAAQWSNEEILTVNALEAMWAAGGEVVTRDGRLVQNEDTSAVEFDDGALDGLRKLARAYNDRGISLLDEPAPNGSRSTLDEPAPNGSRSTDAFKAGRALYMRNWPVANDVLRDLSSGSTMPFRVAGMKWDSVLGGQNLAIAESTDQPRAAQAFIEFMASPASQLLLFEVGGFAPVRTETYSDASSVSRSYAQELRTAVERARHRPVTPCYIRFSEEFHNGIARALNNNGNLEPDLPRILSSAAKCQ